MLLCSFLCGPQRANISQSDTHTPESLKLQPGAAVKYEHVLYSLNQLSFSQHLSSKIKITKAAPKYAHANDTAVLWLPFQNKSPLKGGKINMHTKRIQIFMCLFGDAAVAVNSVFFSVCALNHRCNLKPEQVDSLVYVNNISPDQSLSQQLDTADWSQTGLQFHSQEASAFRGAEEKTLMINIGGYLQTLHLRAVSRAGWWRDVLSERSVLNYSY